LASASLSATFAIDAADAQLIDLVIAPKSLEIPAGARATFQAYGVYDDGHAALLDPSEGTWFVDDENVDSLGGGVFQANTSGGTTVHYQRDDLSAEARLNVIEVTTQAVVIVGNATLQLGTQATFSAFQSLSNGTVGPCSNPFWSVNAGPATVDRFGTVTATGVGDTTLTVDCGEASGHLDLHVLDRAKVGFLLSPQLRSVPVGGQFAFQTFDLYSDGTLVNVTAQTTFATTSTNALTAGGAFTATTQGTAFVHATRGTDVALGTIQVGPPAVVALVAQPAPPLLAVGGTLQLAAYALYSDGALVDRTAHATFATPDATFSVTPQGLVTGLQSGSAAVTLTDLDSGFTGTAMVYVVPAGYPLITGPVVFSNVTSDSAHVHIPVSGQITDGVASFITGNDELARYYYNLPTDRAPDGLDFDIPYTCLGGPGMALNFSLGGPSGTTYYYSSNQPFGQLTIQTSGYFGPAGLPVAILDAPASTCTFPDLIAPQFQETTVEQGGLAHLIVHVTDNTVTEGVDLRRPGSSNSYGGAVDAAFLDDGLVSLTVATSCVAPATSIYAQLYAQDSAGLHTRYALPAGPLTAYDVRHGNSVNGEKAAGQSTFAPASIKVVPGACNFGGFTTAPHWSVNQA
ncbi:MAG: hypothetical protein JST92_26580, partial [Deltaproteobacteria bacterium]|nr:hypothetical protein [Deltaproteobacteria bacterium]